MVKRTCQRRPLLYALLLFARAELAKGGFLAEIEAHGQKAPVPSLEDLKHKFGQLAEITSRLEEGSSSTAGLRAASSGADEAQMDTREAADADKPALPVGALLEQGMLHTVLEPCQEIVSNEDKIAASKIDEEEFGKEIKTNMERLVDCIKKTQGDGSEAGKEASTVAKVREAQKNEDDSMDRAMEGYKNLYRTTVKAPGAQIHALSTAFKQDTESVIEQTTKRVNELQLKVDETFGAEAEDEEHKAHNFEELQSQQDDDGNPGHGPCKFDNKDESWTVNAHTVRIAVPKSDAQAAKANEETCQAYCDQFGAEFDHAGWIGEEAQNVWGRIGQYMKKNKTTGELSMVHLKDITDDGIPIEPLAKDGQVEKGLKGMLCQDKALMDEGECKLMDGKSPCQGYTYYEGKDPGEGGADGAINQWCMMYFHTVPPSRIFDDNKSKLPDEFNQILVEDQTLKCNAKQSNRKDLLQVEEETPDKQAEDIANAFEKNPEKAQEVAAEYAHELAGSGQGNA